MCKKSSFSAFLFIGILAALPAWSAPPNYDSTGPTNIISVQGQQAITLNVDTNPNDNPPQPGVSISGPITEGGTTIATDGTTTIGTNLTTTHGAPLVVAGSITIGADQTSVADLTSTTVGCDSSHEGEVRYNKTTHYLQVCTSPSANTWSWSQVSPSGGGVPILLPAILSGICDTAHIHNASEYAGVPSNAKALFGLTSQNGGCGGVDYILPVGGVVPPTGGTAEGMAGACGPNWSNSQFIMPLDINGNFRINDCQSTSYQVYGYYQ